MPKYDGHGNVSATLDDTTVYSGTVTLDGTEVKVSVRGHEATSVFKFFVDGKLIYKCNVNFTSSPVALSNITTYEYVDATTTTQTVEYFVPNVVGRTYSEAIVILRAAGFRNIVTADGVTAGVVVKMEPANGVSVSPDKEITLTMGGESDE